MIFSKYILNNYLLKLLFLSLLASTAFAYSGGTGEPNTPYQIASVSDWNDLMHTSADWDKHFIMAADVNLQGVTVTPVGDYTTNFTGVFDGNNHIISNVDINMPGNGCVGLFGYICTGAQIRNLGIEDVNIINGSYYVGGLVGANYGGSIINCRSTGTVSGFDNIGGLVGCNNTGSITNSYSTGAVSGYHNIGGLLGGNYGYSTVTSCYSAGSVSGNSDSQYLGGLIGCSDRSNIQNCYSTGTVSGVSNSKYIGGLVGYCNYGSVTDSYSTGTVSGASNSSFIGGLVGESDSSITTNCYSTGTVSGGGDDFAGYIGGLVGRNYYSGITNCYSTGAVSDHRSSGGLVGYNYFGSITASFWDVNTSGWSTSDGGTGKTTAEMKTLSTFTSAGWNFLIVWDINDGQTYPFFFKKTNYSGGNGTPTAPYQIASLNELRTLAGTVADYNKCFILTADIDMAGGQSCPTAIIAANIGESSFQGTPFTGTFDGNGHKITNLTINGGSNSYIGLFGYIDSGSVKNLGIENFSVSGYQYVSGLIGYNDYGGINNCCSTGTVSEYLNSWALGGLVGYNNGNITNCYSTCTIIGTWGVGGLVGTNDSGNITNCYSTGTINGSAASIGGLVGRNYSGSINDCYSTSTVSGGTNGGWDVGGLVGNNDSGSITNSYSTGVVSGGTEIGGLLGESDGGSISYCYATGVVVSSDSEVGGLVGINAHCSISNCYATGTVSGASGSSDIGGLVGYNNSNISNCYSTGTVSGPSNVGGLLGHNYCGAITNCYATGAVTGTSSYIGGLVGENYLNGSIRNCYSTGAISGSQDVGGLVGETGYGIIVNSFWDINTSGQSTSAGGTGKTTAQMKTLLTFTSAGWDFSYTDGDEAIWFMAEDGYPIFTWQISPADIYIDGKNNFRDFAVLARFWMRDDCRMYNHFCDWADLNFDGSVDIDDLAIFMTYWLQSGIYE